MIRLFHVYKRYGEYPPVLSDVSLQVEKGECILLVGKSGAGKTTLLKLLYAEERADRGRIVVAGYSFSEMTRSAVPMLRQKMGIICHETHLINRKTVFENVALPLQIIGIPRNDIKRRVYDTLQAAKLYHRRDHYPPHLSNGERQLVSVARAIVKQPPILLADEPTRNLDTDLSWIILERLKQAHIAGTTLIVTGHRGPLFPATRCIRLQNGSLTPEERS